MTVPDGGITRSIPAVWGDVPTASLLLGSAIVVASGFFLFWREARLQRAAVAPRAAKQR